jgi:hypothetical protein
MAKPNRLQLRHLAFTSASGPGQMEHPHLLVVQLGGKRHGGFYRAAGVLDWLKTDLHSSTRRSTSD